MDSPNAPYALFEFTGALSRATLFSNWKVSTNDQATLEEMASPDFDPAKTVLLPKQMPTASNSSATNQDLGSVKITDYKPADITLEATASNPSVLMLADKFDSAWHVWVDGKKGEVLRCDFLLRGVYLEPGHHVIEFKFRPNIDLFYVNVAAIFVGICLVGYVIVASRRKKEDDDSPAEPGS
jgi:uncharacterized membrane protein YfhO